MPSADPCSRADTRASRRSAVSTAAPSDASDNSSNPEITEISSGLHRMENKALQQQRVELSDEKDERMRKIALGAKLDRALSRRMSSQDAVMRPRRQTASSTTMPPPAPAVAEDRDEAGSRTASSSIDDTKPAVIETTD